MSLAALPQHYGLKPCPFCGHQRQRMHKVGHGVHFIVCLNLLCNMKGPQSHDAEGAMEKWNARRATDFAEVSAA